MNHSIWYEQGANDLSVCLLFRSESDARNFQNKLANFSILHIALACRIEFDERIYDIFLNEKPPGIFYSHYDTKLYGSPECLSLKSIAVSSSKADVDHWCNESAWKTSLCCCRSQSCTDATSPIRRNIPNMRMMRTI